MVAGGLFTRSLANLFAVFDPISTEFQRVAVKAAGGDFTYEIE